jgi:hypothetical protein
MYKMLIGKPEGRDKVGETSIDGVLLLQYGETVSVELRPLTGPLSIPQMIYE